MDASVLVFALALSITSGVLFGLAPAFAASRPDLIQMLRSSGIAASQITSKRPLASLNLRAFLLVAQVSLSLVLLIGTALLIESVNRLRGVNLGFDPANVLTVSLSLPPSRYQSNRQRALFFEQLTERLATSPRVRSVASAMFLPMMNYAGIPVQDAAKPVLKLNERPVITFSVITPGYFRTLGIPLHRGRDFTARDQENTQRVAIIDEALARRFWPAYPRGLDPVGQHLWVGGVNPHPAEIVGIAANIHQMLENSAWPETVYVAFAQSPQPFATLAVRASSANPLALTGAVREQVQKLDKDQAISAFQTMNHLIDEQVGSRRLLTILLGSFAAMALLLVLAGIYGSVAYSVAQRTQEVGVRCALGAQPADILRLVVGQSIRLAVAGVVIGRAGAFALTRLLQDLLFHISPTDPATFLTVVLLFFAVTLAASYIPARRATRIDPATALRT